MKIWFGGLLIVLGVVFVMAGSTGNANRLFIAVTGTNPLTSIGLASSTSPGSITPASTAHATPLVGSYPQHPPVSTPGLVTV